MQNYINNYNVYSAKGIYFRALIIIIKIIYLNVEINTFLEEEVQPKLNNYLKGIRLDEVLGVFNSGQEEIDRHDKQIEDAAIAFFPNGQFPEEAYEHLRKQRGMIINNFF